MKKRTKILTIITTHFNEMKMMLRDGEKKEEKEKEKLDVNDDDGNEEE